MNDKPIFICGLRKSCTSFVKRLFDGHPDLFVCPANELHLFKYTTTTGRKSIQNKKLYSDDPRSVLNHLLQEPFFIRLENKESTDYLNNFSYKTFKKNPSLSQIFPAIQYGFSKALYTSHVDDNMQKHFDF